MTELDVVTGAFSYTGRHIAEELLGCGRSVRLLVSEERARGDDRFDDWLVANAATLGRSYQSELGWNFRGRR